VKAGNDRCLLNLFFNSYSFADLIGSDETVSQLKNAGGLRLLPREDADSILSYDKLMRALKISETSYFQETQTSLREVISSLYNSELGPNADNNAPVLFDPKNTAQINRYFNLLGIYVLGCNLAIQRFTDSRQRAVALLEYFKEKYGFGKL
jgi:hypothetical protein